MNVVPLRYVIRENENPPIDGSRIYASFIYGKIYCSPLTGTFYDADKYYVHQEILSFTTGQPS